MDLLAKLFVYFYLSFELSFSFLILSRLLGLKLKRRKGSNVQFSQISPEFVEEESRKP